MRNLKRVLSLALALVMMLSLMIVGAGAAESTKDFTDADEIQNIEAVDVLVTLNVINGKDNGSFDPNGNVTRAEMAKMICVVLNGGSDPLLGSEANTLFTDTVNHWAKAYIAYSSNLGIVAGRGNGIFDPNANVTGTEAAKMLLVALGYDAEVFHLVGSEWATTTEVIANDIDLFDGMRGTNLSAPLSRDGAAQMIYNALNAYIMTRTYDKVLNNGTISYNYSLSPTKTLLNDTYGAYRVEGVVVANEYSNLAGGNKRPGETDITITNTDELNGAITGTTFKVSTGHDELGKAVVLYVKPAQSSTNANKATVIGGVIMGDNTVLAKDKKYNSTKALEDALKEAGLKTTLPGEYYVNGAKNSNAYDKDDAENVNGYYTQFIDNNGDGAVDYVLVDKVDFGKVTVYSTKDDGSITIATAGTPVKKTESKNVVGFEDVKKDDYVLYAEVGTKLYVAKAESIVGTLTDYSKQVNNDPAGASLWVDKTKYNNSGAAGWNYTGSKLSNPNGYTTLDKEATFYFDACGYIVAVDGTVIKQYAVATYYNPTAASATSIATAKRAQVTFEDGTTGTPVIATTGANQTDATTMGYLGTLGSSSNNYATNVVLGSYTYNSNDELVLDGRNREIVTGGTFKYTSGNVLAQSSAVNYDANGYLTDGSGNRVYMTDNTVLFVVETKGGGAIADTQVSKVTTYNGKDTFPSFELTGGTYKVVYLFNTEKEITAMAVISSKLTAVSDNYLYVIEVISSAAKTKNVKAVVGGEVKDITVNIKSDDEMAGILYEYTVDKDGNYDVKEIETNYVAGVIERVNTNERTIVVDGIEYKVDDKTDIANTEDKEMITFEELRKGDVVCLLHSSGTPKTAKGIYVVEAEAPNNASILFYGVDSDVVGYNNASKKYEVPAYTPVSEILADLVVSGGAEAKDIVKEGPSSPRDPANPISADPEDIAVEGPALWIWVQASDETDKYYPLDVVAAPAKNLTDVTDADQVADALDRSDDVKANTLPDSDEATEVGDGKTLTVTGDVENDVNVTDGGELKVEGAVKGDITVADSGKVVLGEEATVEGTITITDISQIEVDPNAPKDGSNFEEFVKFDTENYDPSQNWSEVPAGVPFFDNKGYAGSATQSGQGMFLNIPLTAAIPSGATHVKRIVTSGSEEYVASFTIGGQVNKDGDNLADTYEFQLPLWRDGSAPGGAVNFYGDGSADETITIKLIFTNGTDQVGDPIYETTVANPVYSVTRT